MATTKEQGVRLYYATASTAWVALAGGASPSGSFTQVTNVRNVKPTPYETEKFDDSDLEDTAKIPKIQVNPGMLTFKKKKNAQTTTLHGFCDGGTTKKAWVILYLDGTAWYTGSGFLECTGGGEANAGDFKSKVMEDFQVTADGVLTYEDHA